MIIKCIHNKAKELPNILFSKYKVDDEFYIEKGQIYIVYAMYILNDMGYYLIDDSSFTYPIFRPAPLFEITNEHLSKYWVYSYEALTQRYAWGFPEFVTDPYFYANVVEDEEGAPQIFQKYKALMDVEFPNPSISKSAKILDEKWLLCEDCMDAWESNTSDAMIFCPLCLQMLHNPRFSPSLFKST